MKKCCFSGLIFYSLFLVAAQTIGQNAGPDKAPVTDTATTHPAFYATIRNDEANRQVVILHWSTHDLADVDRYMIEKSTDATADSIYRDEDPFPVGQSNFSSQANFYRLATLFKNGNKRYSPIIVDLYDQGSSCNNSYLWEKSA